MTTKIQNFLLLSVLLFSGVIVAQNPRNHRVLFDNESFTPAGMQLETLEKFIADISLREIKTVQLTGSCDDQGNTDFNDSLSYWRAAVIRRLMVQGGIPLNVISIRAQGEIPLGEFGEIETQRQANRRVDILVTFEPPKEIQPAVEAEPEKKPLEGKAQQIFTENSKVGDKIILENILFEGGRHYILPESEQAVKSLLYTLKNNPKYHVVILGHVCCESEGRDGFDNDTRKYNLSEARARAIYNYLVENGIPKERLAFKGMKSDFKLGKGDKYDRRVEIEITRIVE